MTDVAKLAHEAAHEIRRNMVGDYRCEEAFHKIITRHFAPTLTAKDAEIEELKERNRILAYESGARGDCLDKIADALGLGHDEVPAFVGRIRELVAERDQLREENDRLRCKMAGTKFDGGVEWQTELDRMRKRAEAAEADRDRLRERVAMLEAPDRGDYH